MAQCLECRPGDRGVLAPGVRILPVELCIGTLVTFLFTPHCQNLSEETLKAIGPFYLVSMPGHACEVKDGLPVTKLKLRKLTGLEICGSNGSKCFPGCSCGSKHLLLP